MSLVSQIGLLSDILTHKILRMHDNEARNHLMLSRQGFIRKAQLKAILSTSRPMMIANITNASALLLLENLSRSLSFDLFLWATLIYYFAFCGLRSASLPKEAQEKATVSLRASGKIVIMSSVLAFLWTYPLIAILPNATLVEFVFVGTVSAGMVAGGAIALYPNPLAGIAYVSILSSVAFGTIALGGVLPPLPFAVVIVAFCTVVVFSMTRHTGLFLQELAGKLEAEQQGEMMNLLLGTYQGQGDQYIWRSNASFELLNATEPLFQLLELSPSSVASRNLKKILVGAGVVAAQERNQDLVSEILADGTCLTQRFETTLRVQDRRFFRFAGRPILGETGEVSSFYGYLKEITEEVQKTEKFRHLATRDAMTGLLNHREFTKQADSLLSSYSGDPERVRFLFIDADNLKSINDNFGHAVGDQLILEMASRLRAILPDGSLIARKGGDEFVCLVFLAEDSAFDEWCDLIKTNMVGSFRYSGVEVPLSCCLGTTAMTKSTVCSEVMELEADRALYHSKSMGKGQSCIYNAELGSQIHRRRALSKDLNRALRNNDLFLLFQPILSTADKTILAVEALLRWQHPKFGYVSPEEVIDIAQREGLSHALFRFVLSRAARQAIDWPSDCSLSVNVAGSCLEDMAFPEIVAAVLQTEKFPGARLWLEVTEAEDLHENKTAILNLLALRAMGLKVAIDDFGTGYSSFSYLDQFPCDIVKMDRSLVHNCDTNLSNGIIIDAMNELAAINGFKIVAEGVETGGVHDRLQVSNISMVQGYWFHRPKHADEIAKLLMKLECKSAA